MKNVSRCLAAIAAAIGVWFSGEDFGYAAYSLNNVGVTQTISFNGFTAPSTWATTTPTANRLDSNEWTLDFESSTKAALFGDDGFEPGFGRGVSNGGAEGTSIAGVYAFNVAENVVALGVQSSTSMFTPGCLTLRIQNNTGTIVTKLDLAWDVYVYNDKPRSSAFDFLYSATNADGSYVTPGVATNVVTPVAEDAPGVLSWVKHEKSFTITGLSLADGAYYYLRWAINDLSTTPAGTFNRDELGLAGIKLTALGESAAPPGASPTSLPEAGSLVVVAGLLGIYGLVAIRRRQQA